jgi:uncharacterized protein
MNTPRRIITYTLRDESGSSDGYYRAIATFADDVLAHVEFALGPTIANYQQHLSTKGEQSRDLYECVFELLTLGVLWRAYQTPNAPYTLEGLSALIGTLELTGKFTQEIAHLRAWHGYLSVLSPSNSSQILERVMACAADFREQAERALGRYTPNVEQFLASEWNVHEERDDSVLRGHKRVEYHLNMVGTEWLSRAFRPAFLATPRKVVLAPPCMRAKPDDECKAFKTAEGYLICQACTPGCRVNQLARLGQKRGFEVYLIPDELRELAAQSVGGGPAVGVVGISCALTNAPGGWEARALNLPAQGLLLDYCGCSYHWDNEGFPTDTNLGKLLELLGLAMLAARQQTSLL